MQHYLVKSWFRQLFGYCIFLRSTKSNAGPPKVSSLMDRLSINSQSTISKTEGQPHWSHFGPGVQSICLLFRFSWQSYHFWLRYRKFHIWPWKFKVKVMAKVKPDGHIWALEFNWYVWFSFRGNRTIFGWDIANSIFDLENLRSRSWPRSNQMVTFEP